MPERNLPFEGSLVVLAWRTLPETCCEARLIKVVFEHSDRLFSVMKKKKATDRFLVLEVWRKHPALHHSLLTHDTAYTGVPYHRNPWRTVHVSTYGVTCTSNRDSRLLSAFNGSYQDMILPSYCTVCTYHHRPWVYYFLLYVSSKTLRGWFDPLDTFIFFFLLEYITDPHGCVF